MLPLIVTNITHKTLYSSICFGERNPHPQYAQHTFTLITQRQVCRPCVHRHTDGGMNVWQMLHAQANKGCTRTPTISLILCLAVHMIVQHNSTTYVSTHSPKCGRCMITSGSARPDKKMVHKSTGCAVAKLVLRNEGCAQHRKNRRSLLSTARIQDWLVNMVITLPSKHRSGCNHEGL